MFFGDILVYVVKKKKEKVVQLLFGITLSGDRQIVFVCFATLQPFFQSDK